MPPDFLSRSEWLAALAVFLAALVLRRSFWSALVSAVKAALGCTLLWLAASPVTYALDALGQAGWSAFGRRLVLPVNELAMLSAFERLGALALGIFFLSAALMLLLGRLSPRAHLFLSGHHSLFMSALLAGALHQAGLPPALTVLTGALILALLQAFAPLLARPLLRALTGADSPGLAHFNLLGYLAGAAAARLLPARVETAPTRPPARAPGSSGVTLLVQEPLAGTAALAALVFLLLALFDPATAGPAAALTDGLILGAGLAIAAYGARLLLGECIPLLQSTADRFAPRAVPALDVPVYFPYMPNLLLPGFLASFTAGLLLMAVLFALGGPVIIPSVVPHFFTGAAAAGFGAALRGRRAAALVSAFTNGLLISLLAAALALLQPIIPATTFSDSDLQLVGILIALLARANR